MARLFLNQRGCPNPCAMRSTEGHIPAPELARALDKGLKQCRYGGLFCVSLSLVVSHTGETYRMPYYAAKFSQ